MHKELERKKARSVLRRMKIYVDVLLLLLLLPITLPNTRVPP